MAKNHRGIGVRRLKLYNQGRGACPVCKRTGVKVIYNRDLNNKKINVCKRCNAALGHGKLQHLVVNL
jgi:hypothetical protein